MGGQAGVSIATVRIAWVLALSLLADQPPLLAWVKPLVVPPTTEAPPPEATEAPAFRSLPTENPQLSQTDAEGFAARLLIGGTITVARNML